MELSIQKQFRLIKFIDADLLYPSTEPTELQKNCVHELIQHGNSFSDAWYKECTKCGLHLLDSFDSHMNLM